MYLKAGKWQNTVKLANTQFLYLLSLKKKKSCWKKFVHVLFSLPFKMYKTSLCCTTGFCTRIQQITAKGLFVQMKHIFTTITVLKIWIDSLCVKPACCQNVLFSGLAGIVFLNINTISTCRHVLSSAPMQYHWKLHW